MSILRKFIGLNRKYSKMLESKFPKFFETPSFKDELVKKIDSSIDSGGISSVLEIGGIDRPLLGKGRGYIYDGLDVDTKEGCYEIYDDFVVQSIEQTLNKKYDLIISITLLEHVPDNESSINTIYQTLNSGHETHHYIPSKWHPYAVALRIVGPVLQKALIPILRPGAEGVSGYPAFFDFCSVPAMRKLFVKNGFTDIEIRALYRANDYFAFFTPLFLVVTTFENVCKKLNLEIFASGFIISAKA